MNCQAFSLTADAAQRIADRLRSGEQIDRATNSVAAFYLETLAASLERLELERAGQLSFLQTAFQAELFGLAPSEAREGPTGMACFCYSQGQ